LPAEHLRDFLISYHTADRAWMEWIAWQLEDAGYSVLRLSCDTQPSADFVQRVQPATQRAERTIALLSPEYLAGVHTADESSAAFARDPTSEKGLVVPFRVDVSRVEELLPDVACIDLVGLNVREVRHRLLDMAGGRRNGEVLRSRTTAVPARPPTARPHFPGAAPRIWTVPFSRNQHFAGREKLLAEIASSLAAGRRVALVQSIHGVGGVGKRQIAIEFAYRHQAEYDAVFWVPAQSPAILKQGIAGLARDIGLADQTATAQSAAVKSAQTWLREQDRWLLILENAAAPEEIADLLPLDCGGHVLITSRQAGWESAAVAITIPVLPRTEAVEVFQRRSMGGDPTAAGILASELGDFPLALAQAAGYIVTARVSVATFRDIYRNRRGELWKSGAGPDDYPRTIATLWDLATRKVPDPVVELMRLCAYLGPEGIPLWLFSEYANDLPRSLRAAAGNPLQRRACINDLTGLALIEATEDTVWVHPLLQAAITAHLPDYEKRRFVHAALRLVSAAFHIRPDDQAVESLAPLLPHALAVLSRAQAHSVAPGLSGRLADRVGLFFRRRGNLSEARTLLEQAITFKQRAHTSDHPTLATSYANLALVELEQGNLPEALRLSQRALAIDQLAYPADHPTLATGYLNLGLVEHALGNLEEAQRLMHAAIGIFDKARTTDHLDLAACCFHLALVERDAGSTAEALYHMRHAGTMRLARLGEKHPATQAALKWLKQHDPEFRQGALNKGSSLNS
jgi:tetratricopeptide (TPR) repeat protein